MKLLNLLQRRFGRYAVPHVTEGIILCQVLVYVLCLVRPEYLVQVVLIPNKVLEGEVWRLFTFICLPPMTGPFWAFFFWWFFYFVGTVLDNTWGSFRYNLYLLTGYLVTIASSFIFPGMLGTNAYLQLSVFFAFAYLYPDYEILIFFMLPVKVKWLALFEWLTYGYFFVQGNLLTKIYIASSVVNFFLFFGRDLYQRFKAGRRHIAAETKKIKPADKPPRHTCSICGATNLSHPKMSFRYCSKCVGCPCYCEEHLRDHAHLVEAIE
jgi:hypothetical protein